MLAGLTGFHLILIVGVLVLLFGATKLPLLAKNLGASAKILKTELKTINDDEPQPARTEGTREQSAAPAAAQPQPKS